MVFQSHPTSGPTSMVFQSHPTPGPTSLGVPSISGPGPLVPTTHGIVGELNIVELTRHIMMEVDRRVDEKIEKSNKNGVVGADGEGKDGKDKDSKDEEKDPKVDIVCLAKGDYIQKVIQLYDGDEDKALNYIKNVGIASDLLERSFVLFRRVYFDGKKKSQFPIRVKDLSRNKLEYLEENGEWVLDIRGEIVGKRLCDNLVSTLLKTNIRFNELIINEQDEDEKSRLMDIYEVNKTQAAILLLSKRNMQGKICRRVAEYISYCTEVKDETGSLENVKKLTHECCCKMN